MTKFRKQTHLQANLPREKINMLFAGWEVRMVKNFNRSLENVGRGQGQHFQARGHSFSLYDRP